MTGGGLWREVCVRALNIRAWVLSGVAIAFAAFAAGCGSVYNLPGNAPLGAALADNNFGREVPLYDDDVLLALSFSGGGTRAAAFSFGVLSELDRSRVGSNQAKSLLDRVDFVSGVSGGAVTAAYFGLKKRAALDDFRERFLLRNAEEALNTQLSLGNIGRALGGGVNDSQLTTWLDRNLFDGARFESFREDQAPRVWINASDIYNRTPFVFGKTAFDALCSDIRPYRIAEAVAALGRHRRVAAQQLAFDLGSQVGQCVEAQQHPGHHGQHPGRRTLGRFQLDPEQVAQARLDRPGLGHGGQPHVGEAPALRCQEDAGRATLALQRVDPLADHVDQFGPAGELAHRGDLQALGLQHQPGDGKGRVRIGHAPNRSNGRARTGAAAARRRGWRVIAGAPGQRSATNTVPSSTRTACARTDCSGASRHSPVRRSKWFL